MDPFWMIEDHRAREKKRLETQIAAASSALALASRVTSIQSHPGFNSFVKALEDQRSVRMSLLVRSKDDSEMKRVQGAIHAYDDILKTLSNAQEQEGRLAETLKKLQNKLDEMVRPSQEKR